MVSDDKILPYLSISSMKDFCVYLSISTIFLITDSSCSNGDSKPNIKYDNELRFAPKVLSCH